MALIKCPECGKEISSKASVCIGCGYPIQEELSKKQEELGKKDELKKEYYCKSCDTQNEIGEDYCINCGQRLTPYTSLSNTSTSEYSYTTPRTFNGIYRVSIFGKKAEVYCPKCGSDNCQWVIENMSSPEKTKTTYSLNLNPLHPFTVINKKEKIVKKKQNIELKKIICNNCGHTFY